MAMQLEKPEAPPTTYVTFRQKGLKGSKTVTIYNATREQLMSRLAKMIEREDQRRKATAGAA